MPANAEYAGAAASMFQPLSKWQPGLAKLTPLWSAGSLKLVARCRFPVEPRGDDSARQRTPQPRRPPGLTAATG